MTLSFRLETELRAGEGAVSEVARHAEAVGARRICVIVDAGLSGNEQAARLVSDLTDVADHVQVLESDAVEPDYEYLDEFRRRPDADLDLMVGVGGGSTLDLAKAVSVLVANPRPAIEYRGFDLIERPGVPLVAVPTTAGTGSEVTPNAVFTDGRERRKLGINSRLYLPKLAVLDPLLTVSCPRAATVSAGLDALVHAVESHVAAAATPFSRLYSREAFRLTMRYLPVVATAPGDVESRFQMQLAAFYAGVALMNSGAGPAGALSYPLGVLFGVPHGFAGGFFLGRVAEWNCEHGADAYEDLEDLLPGPGDVPAALSQLADELGVPRSLGSFGVSASDVPVIVEQSMLLEGALRQNPVPFGRGDLHDLIERLL